MSARRRWATFAGLWLIAIGAALFALAVPFGNSPLTFWATWSMFVLVTFFGGLGVTVAAGVAARSAS